MRRRIVRRNGRQAAGRFIKKAAFYVLRLSGAAAAACLYSAGAIEIAFRHRGYTAYGGEYLMIPFVFYAVFKALGVTGALCRRILQKQKRKVLKRMHACRLEAE